jgi:tartrate dehydrogenase/decarboxylase/D-malate dehydrogenase
VIPGDGIGKEVVPEGIRVLEAAGATFVIGFQWDELPWSCEYYAKTGRMMPEDGLEQIRNHDAIYLKAVGFPGVPARRPTSMASTLPTPLARSGRAR